MNYIATFHTHLSALRSSKTLYGNSINAKLAPVPRKLSSSCGTCVYYTADDPNISLMDNDMQAVYRNDGNEQYTLLYEQL